MNEKKAMTKSDSFWRIRAANYDKLFWVKDPGYISEIIKLADLEKTHIVLDVGTGTGVVANAVKDYVGHVVAIDTSDGMMEKGAWTGTSVIKWDINEALFVNGIFDRIFARMVFHHILENLDRAILRCFDLLKPGGKILVAEGVPPVNDADVVEWYKDVFKLKEARRTFTPEELVYYLSKNGFTEVTPHIFYMQNFSISNWLENSGLDENTQAMILRMHWEADKKIKDAYNMRITGEDCFIRTKNVIIVAKR